MTLPLHLQRNIFKFRDLSAYNMGNITITEAREQLLRDAFAIQDRVARLREKVRWLYYAIVLFQKDCPSCGAARLAMVRDSWCQCADCGHECDPTLCFQTCPECDLPLTKKIYHYWCPRCRFPVRALYCFDARVKVLRAS